MCAYRRAIDLTSRSIHQRSRCLRGLAIAIVSLGFVIIAWALLARSLVQLVGMLLLVPVSGLFLTEDQRILNAWQAALLESWAARDIDVAAFSRAVLADPVLPKGTAEGMLATLPASGNLVAERQLSVAARRVIAAEFVGKNRRAVAALAVKTAASGVAAGALIAAAATNSWGPLWGLTVAAALVLGGSSMNRVRWSGS